MSQQETPKKKSGADASSPDAQTSLYAAHKKLYPRSVKGRFDKWRWILVWLTQLVFYGLCWLPWNGRQAVLFDLVERKFYIFGLVLWPQDVFYLAIILIIAAYALFLFTAIAGRLWCGYACPQTVYTEIMLWFEEKIEGDHRARQKLDRAPLDARKFRIKFTKHSVWILFSLWTGFTFVGYFTPIKELSLSFINWTLGPWETFWIFFYGFATYGNAGFLREQVCKYMCPYARFQSVMFDKDTLVVTYDQERGEPRGSRSKKIDFKSAGLGSCVDCGICVQVCPTGIDIRQGLQYECIGCSACIDGCDEVMDKMGYPRGLIRYSTEHALAEHWGAKEILGHVVRPRVLIYTAILVVITGALAWAVTTRVPLKVNVLRDRSQLARETDEGKIENVYRLQLMNTSEQVHHYVITVSGLNGLEISGETKVEVAPAMNKSVAVEVRSPADAGQKGSNKIYFDVKALENEEIATHEKATFYRP